MRINRIAPGTDVFPNARTIHLERGSDAVLLLHGWTGYTGRLAPLGDRLANAGFTVHIPRLPGHGTSLADFLSVSWRDWVRSAMDEYMNLRATHPTVHVAGASMGGLLSIIVGALFDVPRIALLAPALKTSNRFLFLSPAIQYVVPRIGCGWDAAHDPDPEAGPIGAEYKQHNYMRAIAQLYHLQRFARGFLHRLSSATLTVVSTSDETVPASVGALIARRLPSDRCRTLTLERSGHQMVQGVEGDTVCAAVLDWFSERR